IDGRMIGQVEIENLGNCDMKKMLERHRIFRQRAVETFAYGAFYRAAIAQSRTQNGANQRAVARLQRQILRMAVAVIGQPVERSVFLDHRAKQPRRAQARSQTGAICHGIVALRLLVSALLRGICFTQCCSSWFSWGSGPWAPETGTAIIATACITPWTS